MQSALERRGDTFGAAPGPTPEWEALLVSLRDLGQQMLNSARVGDWDRVTELEAHRQGVIDRLFAQPVPQAIAPQLDTCVQEVLTSNNEVMALAQQKLGRLTEQLKTFSKRRKAQSAYTACA